MEFRNKNTEEEEKDAAYVVPVLLYDNETQGKYLIEDSFEKNPFMKGIHEKHNQT